LGDGSPTFRDTSSTQFAWAAILNRYSNVNDPQLAVDASRLGIDLTLGGNISQDVGVFLWSHTLPMHTIPHVFANPKGYQVELTDVTSSGSVTTLKDIATMTSCPVFVSFIYGGISGCDIVQGLHIVTTGPKRWPDYYMYQLSGDLSSPGMTANVSAGLTVASTGDIYLSLGANAGLAVGAPAANLAPVFGIGFVEASDGPKPAPSIITNYVDGWTYNEAFTGTFGLGPVQFGLAEAIVVSPPNLQRNNPLGGEEFFVSPQKSSRLVSFGASATLGGTCSIHLGSVQQVAPALASLKPSPTGPWPWESGGSVPTVTSTMVATVFSLLASAPDVEQCLTPSTTDLPTP
jgi:hypothetical protein